MAKKVLKFGGTSVGSIKRILHAAKIIKKEHNNGNKLIAENAHTVILTLLDSVQS